MTGIPGHHNRHALSSRWKKTLMTFWQTGISCHHDRHHPLWWHTSIPISMSWTPCHSDRYDLQCFSSRILKLQSITWTHWTIIIRPQTMASLVAQMVCLQCWRPGFDLWIGTIPWRRAWLPTPVFLPREFHGQRSLEGCSPWSSKESDTTEKLTLVRQLTTAWPWHSSVTPSLHRDIDTMGQPEREKWAVVCKQYRKNQKTQCDRPTVLPSQA